MRPPRAWLVLLLTLAVATTSCTGDSAAPPRASVSGASRTPPATTAPTPTSTASITRLDKRDATLEVTIRQLQGGVPSKARGRLRRAIGRPIASWVDAGFTAGPYPRSGFRSAFSTWTPQAARLGRSDRDVTTNAALGPRVSDVSLDRASARLFVFASSGVTGGATAKVHLRLQESRSNGKVRAVVVSGSLYLTRQRNRWEIFGYDLSREVQGR